jgi:hypothetical protein
MKPHKTLLQYLTSGATGCLFLLLLLFTAIVGMEWHDASLSAFYVPEDGRNFLLLLVFLAISFFGSLVWKIDHYSRGQDRDEDEDDDGWGELLQAECGQRTALSPDSRL